MSIELPALVKRGKVSPLPFAAVATISEPAGGMASWTSTVPPAPRRMRAAPFCPVIGSKMTAAPAGAASGIQPAISRSVGLRRK